MDVDAALLAASDLGMDDAGWTDEVMEEAEKLLPTLLDAGYVALDDDGTSANYTWWFTPEGVARIRELRPDKDDEE